MSHKRTGDELMSNKSRRPKFAGANQYVFSGGFERRDTSVCLEQLAYHDQAIFLRPTQMGKTSLLTLANALYDKNDPEELDVAFKPRDAKSMYVLSFDFLQVPMAVEVETFDANVKEYIRNTVMRFIDMYPELKTFYEDPIPSSAATATDSSSYIMAAASAVSAYGLSKGVDTKQSLLVLVDEYDKPVRDLLLDFIGEGEADLRWTNVKGKLINYRRFFSSFKTITHASFKKQSQGLLQAKVWVTGVLPIALKVISDFDPERLTFRPPFADALGLRGEDVDRMLDAVHRFFPFKDEQEKSSVRAAIGELANRLYFVSDTPLYHTRVVNSMMNALLFEQSRRSWLRNLRVLPVGTHFQTIPETVYDVIRNQAALRPIARDLSLNKEITASLNETLNLADVLHNPMKKDDYLTLLVHLGIASVREVDGQMIFQATSTCFRIPFFTRLLENSLQPLFDAESLAALYTVGAAQIEEFMLLLPSSGMSSLVRWAEKHKRNNILELQFQGHLVGELADSLWSEDMAVTQEDVLDSGRTDVRIAGANTILLLELKQKSTIYGPNSTEMKSYHEQLEKYMQELIERESARPTQARRRVAGFVVVMYNNGKSFRVERTTHNHS